MVADNAAVAASNLAQDDEHIPVVDNGRVQISEQDDRLYRHITLPNKMQVLLIHDPETDKEAAAMDVRVGQTSDPPHLQGTAHFCEHMLFLGTEKYPDEDCYSAFLNSNGGSSNAFTADEDTNYYFDVNAGHLDGALDIFSRFFIDPKFTESATGRELTAIDNENSKNLMSDSWRIVQVLKAISSPEHPWHQFGTGNAKTLGEDPKEAGVDIRAELLKFHSRYYSANLMRLAVLGRTGLDELQKMVVDKFSPVINTDASVPCFDGKVPFGPEQVRQRLNIVPIKETREVMLSWPLPPIDKYYRSKPDGYLSHLVGHEGSGSLLSLLKAKGWANGLSAGPYESATDWSNFMVSVECTEVGIEHVEDIVTMTYQYLNMVREEGIQEWIFRETQAVAAMNFRFSSKGNPMGYVSRLAGNMQLFPSDLCVAGPSLLQDYEPDLIRELLGQIVPSNMVLVAIGREFKGKTDKVEAYYGTEYSCEHLPEGLIKSWEACGRIDELRLPEPNPVIATDFELRPPPPDDAPPEPCLVRDDAACRVWHKSDGLFRKPKLNVRVRLATPVLYDSPESLVLATLLVSLLKEDLNEELYMARQAGLGLDVYLTKEALNLGLGGYSHKMKVLLQRVVQHLASFANALAKEDEASTSALGSQESGTAPDAYGSAEGRVALAEDAPKPLGLFQRVRQKLLKSYKNFEFNTPYQHAMFATQSCLEMPKWSNEDKLSAMEGPGITLSAMLAFIPRLLSMLHVEMLVHGNATATEALELADVVVSGLSPRPLPLYLWPESRVVDLTHWDVHDFLGTREAECAKAAPDQGADVDPGARTAALGPEYRRSLTCPNPEETNSAVEITFQICVDDVEGRALLALFTHLVKDKCFDQLRTKEQLGYLVWSSGSVSGGYVYNARFLVQSNDKSPRYLNDRVEAFLTGFRETLSTMTAEAFASNVQAVVDLILEKAKNLNQETARHWVEIASRTYVFDRNTREAASVASLTPADLLAFYDANFSKAGARRRKVATWVYGNQHSDTEVVKNEASTGEGNGGVGGGDHVNGNRDSASERTVVVIDDYNEFKRSMPLLPLPRSAPVAAIMEASKL